MELNKPKEITLNETQKRQRMQTMKALRQRKQKGATHYLLDVLVENGDNRSNTPKSQTKYFIYKRKSRLGK